MEHFCYGDDMKQQPKYLRREKKYKKRYKMVVDGKSIFVIDRQIKKRARKQEKETC